MLCRAGASILPTLHTLFMQIFAAPVPVAAGRAVSLPRTQHPGYRPWPVSRTKRAGTQFFRPGMNGKSHDK